MPVYDNAPERRRELIAKIQEMSAIKTAKAEKGQRLTYLHSRLAELKAKVRSATSSGGRLPRSEYASICDEQEKIRAEYIALQPQVTEMKRRIQDISEFITLQKLALGEGVTVDASRITELMVDQVRLLKENYTSFAADSTRVSSMRTMAAQIAIELDEILKSVI